MKKLENDDGRYCEVVRDNLCAKICECDLCIGPCVYSVSVILYLFESVSSVQWKCSEKQ